MSTRWVRSGGAKTQGFQVRGPYVHTDFVLEPVSVGNGRSRDVVHMIQSVPRLGRKAPAQVMSMTEDGMLEYPGGSVCLLTTEGFSAMLCMQRDKQGATSDVVLGYRVRSEAGMQDMIARLRPLAETMPKVADVLERVQATEDPLATRH